MKKKILVIVAILSTFLATIGNTFAVSNTVTFHKRNLSGVSIQSGAQTYYKTVTSGSSTIIAYCLNKSLKVPADGSTLSFKGEITDPGYIYIFANGYGASWNSSLLGNNLTNDQKYYATQLALWIYQGKVSTSGLNKSDKSVNAAITLANAAKTNRVGESSISITNPGSSMTKSGDYYQSGYLTVGGNGYENYQVTLINAGADARIVTSTGQVYKSGTRLSKGTRFSVRIPVSKVGSAMNIIVKVDAVGKVNKIYRYEKSSNLQDLGILVTSTKNLSAQTSFSISKPVGSLRIEKTDSETGKLLAGARIQVTDNYGNVISTFTSSNKAYVINNLPLGVYTITETSAPSGYQKLNSSVRVTVTANNTSSVTLRNTPIKKSSVIISKRDITTGRELSGATLVVKNSTGRIIDSWVSTSTPHQIWNLEEGNYTLTETSAPSGYQLSSETIRFTVRNGGNVQTLVMYNTPKSYGVSIIKRDATTGDTLKGATLVLKNSAGKIIDTWVSTDSAHYVRNLSAGNYSVVETSAPTGYVLDSTPVNFTVTKDGQTDRTITLYNTRKSYGIGIVKKDQATGEILKGATLVLKDSTGKVIDTWVSDNSVHYVKNLKAGEYSITETSAPSGYVLNKTPIYFTVTDADINNKTITVYNSKEEEKTGKVKISKQDATTKKELPGASLTLKDANGNVLASWVSTNTPHYVTGLKPGTYTLIETKSPKGYGLSDEVITFTIDANGKVDKEVIMYNSPIPVTADQNMAFVYIGFIGTISLAIFGIYKLSKQN